ncbi:MAG: NUDIX domain-containing protein [Candidatus Methanofastidiosia archaeon]
MNCFILRYSEIGIKSRQTRRRWEEQLRKNVEKCLLWNHIEYKRVFLVQGRLIIYTNDTKAIDALWHVFGLVSYSPANEIFLNIEDLKKTALSLYLEKQPHTFRVTTQRITKKFNLTSQQISAIVGEAICKVGGHVDLTSYELNIGIEIIDDKAYVFSEVIRGVGGLPLGVQKKVCAIVKDKRDLLACWLIMKRGCPVDALISENGQTISFIKFLVSFAFHDSIQIRFIKNICNQDSFPQQEIGTETEAVVSGKPIYMKGRIVNLCPCEFYSTRKVLKRLFELGLGTSNPPENHLISAGGIVYHGDNLLLIKRKKEQAWVLPKGGIENKELFREAAAREICEETGLCDVEVGVMIGKTRYSFFLENKSYIKDVFYFICRSRTNDIHLESIFDDFGFFGLDKAYKTATFDEDKKIILDAEKIRKKRIFGTFNQH